MHRKCTKYSSVDTLAIYPTIERSLSFKYRRTGRAEVTNQAFPVPSSIFWTPNAAMSPRDIFQQVHPYTPLRDDNRKEGRYAANLQADNQTETCHGVFCQRPGRQQEITQKEQRSTMTGRGGNTDESN